MKLIPKAIRLEHASTAAEVLRRAASRAAHRATGPRPGKYLTTGGIRAAERVNGKAATTALLEYHAQHRAGVRKDPEIPSRGKAEAMRRMDVVEVEIATRTGVEQLRRIDTYRGNSRRGIKPNKPDGVVTSAEIGNYGRTGGRLQLEAGPLARFTAALNPRPDPLAGRDIEALAEMYNAIEQASIP